MTTEPERDATGFSTLALALLTLVVGMGMGRLFVNGSYLGPVLASAVAVHLVCFVCRRRGLGLVAAALLSLCAFWVVVGWFLLPRTTAFGLPLFSTWHAVSVALSRAYRDFGETVAPAPVTKGFV